MPVLFLTVNPPCPPPPPLQLWQMVHPPRRKAPVVTAWGLAQMRRVLRVHAGFYGAWAAAPLVKQATEQVRRSGVSEAVLVERGAGAHTRGPGAVAAAAAAGAVHTGAAEHGAAGLGVEGVNGQQAQQAQQHVDGDASSRGKEPGVASGAAGGEGETGLPSAKSSQRGKRPSKASRIRGLPFNRQLMTRLEAVCEERGIDPDRAEFLLTGALGWGLQQGAWCFVGAHSRLFWSERGADPVLHRQEPNAEKYFAAPSTAQECTCGTPVQPA